MAEITQAEALSEARAAIEASARQIEQLARQRRELQALARQIETEVQQLASRRAEREDRTRAVRANPTAYGPQEIDEVYAALSDVSVRHSLMQTQLESLRQRERWLAEQQAAREETQALLARLTAALEAQPDPGPSMPAEATEAATGAHLPPAELARRVVAAREEQNQWLSRRMQDGPMQTMSNLVLRAEVCQRLLARDPRRAQTELESVKAGLAAALDEERRFVADLNPPVLAEVGLRPTIRRHVRETAKLAGADIRLQASGQETHLTPEVETSLFRIVQETLRAALARYAPASIDVEFVAGADAVTLSFAVSGCQSAPAEDALRDHLAVAETYAVAMGGNLSLRVADSQSFGASFAVPYPTNA